MTMPPQTSSFCYILLLSLLWRLVMLFYLHGRHCLIATVFLSPYAISASSLLGLYWDHYTTEIVRY